MPFPSIYFLVVRMSMQIYHAGDPNSQRFIGQARSSPSVMAVARFIDVRRTRQLPGISFVPAVGFEGKLYEGTDAFLFLQRCSSGPVSNSVYHMTVSDMRYAETDTGQPGFESRADIFGTNSWGKHNA